MIILSISFIIIFVSSPFSNFKFSFSYLFFFVGRYIPEEVVTNVVSLISSNEDIQLYAVQKLFSTVKKEPTKTPLVYVGLWAVGEYGDLLVQGNQDLQVNEDDVIELFTRILKHTLTDVITKEYALNSLAKLSIKFSQAGVTEIRKLISPFTRSMNAELQQRSCEYLSIIENNQVSSLKDGLLKRMPPLEARNIDDNEGEEEAEIEEEPNNENVISSNTNPSPNTGNSSSGGNSLINLDNLLGGSTPINTPVNKQTSGGGNLLDDILGGITTPSPTPTPTPNSGGSGGGNLLENLFGTSSQPSVVPLNQNNAPLSSSPPITAYEQDGLKIVFQFAPKENNVIFLNMVSTNSSPTPIENFSILMAVPPYVKLQMAMASGNTVPPNGSSTVEQKVKLMNTLQGQKPILVKIKIDGKHGSNTIAVVHTVNNFPNL